MTAETVQIVVNLVTLIALMGGGGILVFKIGRAVSKFEVVAEHQAIDIKEIRMDVKIIGDATLKLALQEERMTAISRRMTNLEATVKELQHGEGFVFPISAHLGKSPP